MNPPKIDVEKRRRNKTDWRQNRNSDLKNRTFTEAEKKRAGRKEFKKSVKDYERQQAKYPTPTKAKPTKVQMQKAKKVFA